MMNKVVVCIVLFVGCLFVSYAQAQGCCSPPQWEVLGYETNSVGIVFHHIFYDSINRLVRWDREGAVENATTIRLQTFANFTSGIEFLYYPDVNECVTHWPDSFTEWCYGCSVGQTYLKNITVDEIECMAWSAANDEMIWLSSVDGCLPVLYEYKNKTIIFDDATLAITNPSVFVPPYICKASPPL
eukprot:TRINITY_DN1381_c0_g1_i1.p1 TRINITY_DN1381_c0_g1~~TRINITY_DN1381_c0_g1_i1.p1  ORF type:complete len:186 (-),score=30.04 TRINITY_DN1381_c0_g1_i1:31-588(-)